ncbi:MAG: hypothetical protein ACP5RN_12175 [Armatimonadota bacterium]
MRICRALLGLCVLGTGIVALTACGGGGGVGDSVPPIISNLQTRYEGNSLVVQADIVDADTGVQRAWVVRKGLNASQGEVEMQQVSGTNTYRATIADATSRVQVKAQDRAGNVAQTEETRVSPPPPPFEP